MLWCLAQARNPCYMGCVQMAGWVAGLLAVSLPAAASFEGTNTGLPVVCIGLVCRWCGRVCQAACMSKLPSKHMSTTASQMPSSTITMDLTLIHNTPSLVCMLLVQSCVTRCPISPSHHWTRRPVPCQLPALTRYKVLASSAHGLSWLELQPLTNWPNQIRSHCAVQLGAPIVGDVM